MKYSAIHSNDIINDDIICMSNINDITCMSNINNTQLITVWPEDQNC